MNGSKFKRVALPIILFAAGNIGLGLSVFFAIKGTRKYDAAIKELNNKAEEEGREVTKKEKIVVAFKSYLPSGVCVLVTVACNTSGFIISKRLQAKLAAIAAGSTAMLNKLQNTIAEKYGSNCLKDTTSSIGEYEEVKHFPSTPGKKLYFNQYTGFFWADPEKFGLAFREVNDIINDYGMTNLTDFLVHAEAEFPDGSKAGIANREELSIEGWTRSYIVEMVGDGGGISLYPEFEIDQNETEVMRYTKNGVPFKPFIWGPVDPIWDPEEFVLDRSVLYDGGYPQPWNDPRILKFNEAEEDILNDKGASKDEHKGKSNEHIY